MLHYDYSWGFGGRNHELRRQHIAHQRQQAAWNQIKADSINQVQQQIKAANAPLPPELAKVRQSTANLFSHTPIPKDVWHGLNSNRGVPDFLLLTRYTEEVLRQWVAIWMTVSPVGKQVAQEQVEKAAEVEQQRQWQKDEQLLRSKTKALRREIQERYRLESGTVVRVKMPMSKLDGSLGIVRGDMFMDKLGHLRARVEIDPLPDGHPLKRRDPRFRPLGYQPFLEEFKAEMLTREHPEALG